MVRLWCCFSLVRFSACPRPTLRRLGTGALPAAMRGIAAGKRSKRSCPKTPLPDSSSFSGRSSWERQTKDATSVSEPLLASRLINAQGFKDLVLWAGTDTLYAVDSELGKMVWEKHFDVKPSSTACGVSNLGIVIEAPRVINFAARRKPGTPRPPTAAPTPASERRLGICCRRR